MQRYVHRVWFAFRNFMELREVPQIFRKGTLLQNTEFPEVTQNVHSLMVFGILHYFAMIYAL
jgi:hypothetical protein